MPYILVKVAFPTPLFIDELKIFEGVLVNLAIEGDLAKPLYPWVKPWKSQWGGGGGIDRVGT